jgi:tetratricopeptide (TPR) repeat protein
VRVSEQSINPVSAQVLPPSSGSGVRAQIIETDEEPIYAEHPSVEAGRWLALLVVLIIAALIPIAFSLFNGWILQDAENVKDNTVIQAWQGLKLVWRLPHHFPQFSPLGYTVFMLEARVFKAIPAGYHAVNVGLHLMNVLLVWTLLRKLELPGSWLAALVYAVHPINMASVTWISRQPTLLGTCFFLCSLIVYSRYCGLNPKIEELQRFFRLPERPAMLYALAMILFLLALVTYPLTAIFPLVVLVLIWWERGEVTWSDVKPLLPHLLIMLAVLAGAIVIQLKFGGNLSNSLAAPIHLTPLERLVVASRAIWFYLLKILMPVNLSFAYPTWEVGAIWQVIFIVLLAVALGALAVFRKKLDRGMIATALLFLIAVVPVVTIIDSVALRNSFVADQLVYLGSMAILVPIVSVLAARFVPRHFSPTDVRPGPYIAIVVVLILAGLSIKLALAYKDQTKLWADTIDKYSDTVIAHNGLGMMQLNGTPPDPSAAADHFRRALNVDGHDLVALTNLGQAYFQMGDWDRALGQFKMAKSARPDSARPYIGLADLYLQQGYSTTAIEEYQKALKIEPQNDDVLVRLGQAYERYGDAEKAIEQYRSAIKINPRNILAHNYLSVLLYGKGRALELKKDLEGAKAVYEEVAKELQIVNSIDNNYFPVYMSSGAILSNMGVMPKAEIAFRNAVYLKPNNVEARTSLAMVQIRMKKFADAKMHLTAALQMSPEFAKAHYFMGVILVQENDLDGAIQQFEQAINLDSSQHNGAMDPIYLRAYRDALQQKEKLAR